MTDAPFDPWFLPADAERILPSDVVAGGHYAAFYEGAGTKLMPSGISLQKFMVGSVGVDTHGRLRITTSFGALVPLDVVEALYALGGRPRAAMMKP